LVDRIQYPAHEGQFWLAARSTKRVVAVCQTAEHNLAAGPLAAPAKLLTIKNGASPARWDETSEIIPKKGFTAVTVARLAPPKDHATLLEAMTHVPDIHLWIVGDGPLSGALRTGAASLGLEGRVTFLGEPRSVGAYLAAADVFVLSSLSEGIPISLLEAMASGLPAVVTAVGGMEEVIKLSLAGILVPPRTPQALAQALQEYAQKPAKRADHARLARLCYERHFTFERMAEQYMNLYLS
jgi:glycosyltransferase involved in cell wall biosynthesis